MSINDEIMGTDEQIAPETAAATPAGDAPNGGRFRIPEFLKAKTGEGSIESYLDHPLNFVKSKALAQIIRGLTGMFGALNYAIIDIVMGSLNFVKGKGANAQ